MGTVQEENVQLKHSIQLKEDLIKGYGTESDPYSGESTPSVSGKIFRGGYTVQVGFTGGNYSTSQVVLYNTHHSLIVARHGPL